MGDTVASYLKSLEELPIVRRFGSQPELVAELLDLLLYVTRRTHRPNPRSGFHLLHAGHEFPVPTAT